MHSKTNDNGAKSQDLNRPRNERIESIEELLRERGFFDSVKTENKGS